MNNRATNTIILTVIYPAMDLNCIQNTKFTPIIRKINSIPIQIIVAFLKLFLNALKKFLNKYPSVSSTSFKVVSYKAVVAAPMVIIGILQIIQRKFKIIRSEILLINLKNILLGLNKLFIFNIITPKILDNFSLYPFTPVAAIPSTKNLCNAMNIISTGIREINDAAIISEYSAEY